MRLFSAYMSAGGQVPWSKTGLAGAQSLKKKDVWWWFGSSFVQCSELFQFIMPPSVTLSIGVAVGLWETPGCLS